MAQGHNLSLVSRLSSLKKRTKENILTINGPRPHYRLSFPFFSSRNKKTKENNLTIDNGTRPASSPLSSRSVSSPLLWVVVIADYIKVSQPFLSSRGFACPTPESAITRLVPVVAVGAPLVEEEVAVRSLVVDNLAASEWPTAIGTAGAGGCGGMRGDGRRFVPSQLPYTQF